MKKSQKSRHTWYIRITQESQLQELLAACPDLKKQFGILPEDVGGRVSVIRAGPHRKVRKLLQEFSIAIGIATPYRGDYSYPTIKHEVYVRRSPIASLHSHSSPKKRRRR